MRASLQNKPSFFRFKLHLHIKFSEEEEAIIRTRALHNYGFNIAPGYIAGTRSPQTSYSLAIISFALFSVGLLSSFVIIVYPPLSPIGTTFLIGGPALFIYTLITEFSHWNITDKHLTVGYLLNHPYLVISTLDPAQLPRAEQNILAGLTDLKLFLTQTHELATRRIIEL